MNNEIKIVLPSVIHQNDEDVENGINDLCKEEGMRFIDESNIKSSPLNRSKLHLSKSGTALLTKHFAKTVNSD